jgi:hypothetical protein
MSACKECPVPENLRSTCQPFYCSTRDEARPKRHPAVVDTTGAGASCEVTEWWEKPSRAGASTATLTTVFEANARKKRRRKRRIASVRKSS